MIRIKERDLVDGLRAIGISPGDLVYCQSQLYSLGWPEGVQGREDFCLFFLDGIREALGPEGTIVVPTMSTQTGRGTEPFNPAFTPSNYGTLPQYVATHAGFTRSLNPMISVAASGPLAEDICGELSTNNFNVFSPFSGMVRRNGKNLYLGVPLIRAMQLIHYCEFVVGVPYCYNKILDKRPIVNGIVSPKLVTSSVRFMSGEYKMDISRAVEVVEESGLLYRTPLGGGFLCAINMQDIVRLVNRELERDPFFLTDRTIVFQYGDAPLDGLQGVRPPIRDPGCSDRSRWTPILLRIEAHSPRLASFIALAVETVTAGQSLSWLDTLEAFSDNGLREFAWAFNEVANAVPSNSAVAALCEDGDDSLANCAQTFLDRTRHTAYNFLLGYVFAPFAAARIRSLCVAGVPPLHSALTNRFSSESPTIEFARNMPLPTDATGYNYSDICLYAGWTDGTDTPEAIAAWGARLSMGGVLFAEIPNGAIDIPFDNARSAEIAFRRLLVQIGLAFERLHLWHDQSAISLILRRLPT